MEVKFNLCSLNLVLRFAMEVYDNEILTKENIEKSWRGWQNKAFLLETPFWRSRLEILIYLYKS